MFDKFYTQPEVLPMGTLISNTLTEIFIYYITDIFILNLKNTSNIQKRIYRHREVDDTLLLYGGKNRQTKYLHQYINKFHPKLYLTLETEENKRINFLDIIITKTDKLLIYTENPSPQSLLPTTYLTIQNNFPLSTDFSIYL